MKPRKKIPTAQEIIDEHLNGEALTEEMCREMAESLLNRAWIQEWSQKKGHRVFFECCGRYASDEDEPEMQELLLQSTNHREKGYCPFCGESVEYFRQRYIGRTELAEEYHTWYRRSEKDPDVLLLIGVWAGKKYFRARNGLVPVERIRPEFELGCLCYLPLGDTPRRYVREAMPQRGVWGSCTGYFGTEENDWWAARKNIGWNGAVTSLFGGRIHNEIHLETLERAVRGTRWAWYMNWAEETPGILYGADRLNVLAVYSRHPQLEYFIKSGLSPLAAAVVNQDDCGCIRWGAQTPAEMLGLDSNELARLKRLPRQQINCRGLKLKQTAGKLGQKLKLETALELGSRIASYDERDFFRTVEQYGGRWGAARLTRYLAPRRGQIGLWKDYLDELITLGEADDESRVFPKDLTEAHAQTSARLRYRHDRETAEKVRAAAEKLRERYTFRACGLLLEPFESPEEIVREGTMQHICIGSYVERYAGGGTILCKLRRETEPDKPWHAVEFTTGGAMVQCRGDHNRSEEEDLPVLKRFWAAWDRARKTKTELHVQVRRKERAAV